MKTLFTAVICAVLTFPALAQKAQQDQPPAGDKPRFNRNAPADKMRDRFFERMENSAKTVLNNYDADKDGKLSDAEREAAEKDLNQDELNKKLRLADAADALSDLIALYDADKDGNLSKNEIEVIKKELVKQDIQEKLRLARMYGNFKIADENKDGVLSDEEKRTAPAKIRKAATPVRPEGRPQRPMGGRPERTPAPAN